MHALNKKDGYRIVYVTCCSIDEADKIGKQIVKERLCAGVNIIEGMHSFYWWKGKLEEARECVLIAKTKDVLVDKVIKRIKELHSYECPCIIALSIEEGNPDFLDWIKKETKD